MTEPNPLVAVAGNSPVDGWAGIWIAEDIEAIRADVESGSWVDTSIGAVSAGLDALAFVSDPIGSLLQYGAAWIIEHVRPLAEALDWLAGDPRQIVAHAQTWRNVAATMDARADDLDRAVRFDTGEWVGGAAEAYRRWTGLQRDAVRGLAGAAQTMAAITEGAGGLVAGVRTMVRDAIAVLVSRLIDYAAEELLSLGAATPLVVEQVSALCAACAVRIGKWLRGLLASLRRLHGLAGRMGEAIEALKQLLRRLHRAEEDAGLNRRGAKRGAGRPGDGGGVRPVGGSGLRP